MANEELLAAARAGAVPLIFAPRALERLNGGQGSLCFDGKCEPSQGRRGLLFDIASLASGVREALSNWRYLYPGRFS